MLIGKATRRSLGHEDCRFKAAGCGTKKGRSFTYAVHAFQGTAQLAPCGGSCGCKIATGRHLAADIQASWRSGTAGLIHAAQVGAEWAAVEHIRGGAVMHGPTRAATKPTQKAVLSSGRPLAACLTIDFRH